ncbi:transcriptional regulator [Escherichia coli]|uniref:helix-turn-helix domain-containing protein n=1 Tax=Escherichia coli TaxID=562 RepID=UPI0019199EC5|nr:helix-turn-helix transcriptional regulator [Escherichia coli]UMT23365.1 transcriptional regulator [Escherichia coli]CAD6115667.1 putative regulator of the C1 family (possibly fragment) [Escherichia coli]HAX0302212.1 helix-turn-helix transcriptional regulator [Escherichia coli CD471]
MNLGEYLHHSRITQKNFAEIVGATQGMVSHVITGRAKLTGEKILRWCEATGWVVTPHEIDSSTYPNPTDGLPVGCKANTQNTPEMIHENQA